ncbi:pentatricopeptide repeat (PPR) superfamily protein [Wolffia australiana]
MVATESMAEEPDLPMTSKNSNGDQRCSDDSLCGDDLAFDCVCNVSAVEEKTHSIFPDRCVVDNCCEPRIKIVSVNNVDAADGSGAAEKSCEPQIKIFSGVSEDTADGNTRMLVEERINGADPIFRMEHETEIQANLASNDQASILSGNLCINGGETGSHISTEDENLLKALIAEIELAMSEKPNEAEEDVHAADIKPLFFYSDCSSEMGLLSEAKYFDNCKEETLLTTISLTENSMASVFTEETTACSRNSRFLLNSQFDEDGEENDLVVEDFRSLDCNNSAMTYTQPKINSFYQEQIGMPATDSSLNIEEIYSESTDVSNSTSSSVITTQDFSEEGLSGSKKCLNDVSGGECILEGNDDMPMKIQSVYLMHVDDQLPNVQSRMIQSECQLGDEYDSVGSNAESKLDMPMKIQSVYLMHVDDQLPNVQSRMIQSECQLGDEYDSVGSNAESKLESGVVNLRLRPENQSQNDRNYETLDDGREEGDEAEQDFSDELTLEEGSTYSVFKFQVVVKGDTGEFNRVSTENTEENSHNLESSSSEASQKDEVTSIGSSAQTITLPSNNSQSSYSPKPLVGSEPRNFISLEAWIDESVDAETVLNDDDKEAQNTGSPSNKAVQTEETRITIINPEEFASQHDQVVCDKVLAIFEETNGTVGRISVSASSPAARYSVSFDESRKGNEGILRRRGGILTPRHDEKIQVGTFSEVQERGEIVPCLEGSASLKQHTPLKSLLMETSHEVSQETVTLIPLKKQTKQGAVLRKTEKEWNSPVKLPGVDHRRVKARPQWVPFLCCPSIH